MLFKSTGAIAVAALITTIGQYALAEDESIDINVEVNIDKAYGITKKTNEGSSNHDIKLIIRADNPTKPVEGSTSFCTYNNSSDSLKIQFSGEENAAGRKLLGDDNGFYVFGNNKQSAPIDVFYDQQDKGQTSQVFRNTQLSFDTSKKSLSDCLDSHNSTLIVKTRPDTSKYITGGDTFATTLTLTVLPE